MKSRLISLAFAGAMMLAQMPQAFAAQGSNCMPTTGTVSGLTFAQKTNDSNEALLSAFSGASPPATSCSGAAVKGQVWLDTQVTPNVLRRYDGTNWVAIGAIDSANHVWSPPVGGGTASISAATTTDICASPSAVQAITGTTTIASFGSGCPVGVRKTLIFNSATPLTYNATSMILPALRDYTTSAGDAAEAIHLGAGNWRVLAVNRIDGSAVTNPSVPLGTALFGFYANLAPAKTVYGLGQALSRTTYADYFLAATRSQTATLTSGSATITSVPGTNGFGAGMPIEGIGIQAGTTIVSVTSSTITMSKTATETGSRTVRVFPFGYGSGGDTNTVGVPECMGKVLAGREGITGGAGIWLNAGSTIMGNVQGSALSTLQTVNLPPYTPSGSVSTSITGGGTQFYAGSGTIGIGYATGSQPLNVLSSIPFVDAAGWTLSSTPSFNAQGGTSTPFSNVQPTLVAECVVVVQP